MLSRWFLKMIRSGTSKRAVTQWTRQSEPGQGPQYIEVPANWKVLVVEDALVRQLQFRDWLGSNAKIVAKVNDAIAALHEEQFDLVFLDHDLGLMILHVLSDAKIRAKIVPYTLLGLIRS